MFAYYKLDNEFSNTIKIRKNKVKLLPQQNRIAMEYKEFEKYFDIYCDDELYVKDIISKEMMNLLINFYETHKLLCEIVIKKNKIYLRVFTGPVFEINIVGKLFDKTLLYRYYYLVKIIKELMENMNAQLN